MKKYLLVAGNAYKLDRLCFDGWVDTEKHGTEGYNWREFFLPGGIYLGPDMYGVQPRFREPLKRRKLSFECVVLCTPDHPDYEKAREQAVKKAQAEFAAAIIPLLADGNPHEITIEQHWSGPYYPEYRETLKIRAEILR